MTADETSPVGKKNRLFTGSERAGQRAAAIQSLLGTASQTEWVKFGGMAKRHAGETAGLAQ